MDISEITTIFSNTNGSVYDTHGRYVFLPDNSERIDFHPVTHERLGFLFEETSENAARRSDNMTVSPWGGSVLCEAAPEKDYGENVFRVSKRLTSGSESYSQTLGSSTTGATYCYSISLLASENSKRIHIGIGAIADITGGTWGDNKNVTFGVISGGGTMTQSTGALIVVDNLDEIVPTRVFVTRKYESVRTFSIYLYPDTASSGTIGRANYAFAPQLETNTFPTSYIRNTTTGIVTRNSDQFIIRAEKLNKFYNQKAWTVLVEATYGDNSVDISTSFGFEPFATRINVGVTPTDRLPYLQIIGETNGFSGSVVGVIVPTNGKIKFALSVDVNGYIFSTDTLVLRETTTPLQLPEETGMHIGNFASSPVRALNGHMTKLRYIPAKLTFAEIQAEFAKF